MAVTLVALYDSLGDAAQVRRDLEAAGVPSRDISISDNTGQGIAGTQATRVEDGREERRGGGLLDWLFGVPDEDAAEYRRGLERGNTLVSVVAAEPQVDAVENILGRYGPIDIDEKRSDVTAGTAAAMQTPTAEAGREETVSIPVVEEELEVGKRTVERGGVRVRRYVVERPVEAEVRLRDETIDVERRPATGAEPVGEGAFKEQTFDVRERDEEAVVAKTPRVKEEVVVRKDVQEKTATVRDKVRRAEVEVEGAGTGASPGPADKSRR